MQKAILPERDVIPSMPDASTPGISLEMVLPAPTWERICRMADGDQWFFTALLAAAAHRVCRIHVAANAATSLLLAIEATETNAFDCFEHTMGEPDAELSIGAFVLCAKQYLMNARPLAYSTVGKVLRCDVQSALGSTDAPLLLAVGDTAPESCDGLLIWVGKSSGTIQIKADESLHLVARCRTLLSDFVFVVGQLVANAEAPLASVCTTSPLSQQIVRAFGRGEEVQVTQGRRIEWWLQQQAELRPDAIAVTTDAKRVTYAEINRMANRAAFRLRASNVGGGDIVAVSLQRGIPMIAAIYGALKIGAIYLPVDPSYPLRRRLHILTDSGAMALVCGQHDPDLAVLPLLRQHVWSEDALEDGEEIVPSPHSPCAVAYMIYTSGSTGQPKGVKIAHDSVFNRIEWMQNRFGLQPGHVVLQKTPISFDVSVWELFWWALAGATVYLPAPNVEMQPAALIGVIERHRITHMHFVPTMLSAFLSYLGSSKEHAALRSLMYVYASGEALSASDVSRFRELVQVHVNAKLVNLYGPTEATIDVTCFEVPADFDRLSVPIGRPIQNTQIYLVDEADQLVAPGVVGELLIGGANVGVEYHQRPELTARRFCVLPHLEGGRLYRTGDIARWSFDGEIEYLGRADDQFKIRGYRVEPGEVEAQLSLCAGVDDVRVLAVPRPQGGLALVAYLVTNEGPLNANHLRSELNDVLPEFMVPAHFVQVTGFPVGPSGKLDRHSLPDPWAVVERDPSCQAVSLTTAETTEASLEAIWKSVLSIEELDQSDDFFSLGGDSILALNVLAECEALGMPITFEDLFEYTTIADLSQMLAQRAYRHSKVRA